MTDFFADDSTRGWARRPDNKPYLLQLIANLEERSKGYISRALEPGDKDFEKGYARALISVRDNLTQLLTDTVTETVSDRHGNGNG